MKTFFTVVLFTIYLSIFGFAQTDLPKSADWETFAPENEEFWIDIPIALNASLFKNDNSNNDFNRRYLNSFDGTYFYIFSDNPKTAGQFKYIAEVIKTYKQTGKTERIGEFETEKFSFPDNGDFYHTILTVKGKNRFYVFQTISLTKENLAVDRFFGSIKLSGKSSAENFVEMKNEKDITIKIPTAKLELKPNLTNNGNVLNPREKAQDNSVASKKPSVSKTSGNTTIGVRILTKPRANYTDFARFYEITGKVTLRVTFSANGTIGAISPFLKLPFGLTEQAISAARGIRFEPATRDGVAFSVTKPVEYSFTIY